ncbi:hypothetical protein Q5P01_006661 [Channa striata]|uniref:Protein kinase domain-containing protein n=1 Tax=Channa striata TaxID=64152 RepID=A0AA88T4L7_CHASR|nr:hypothetical protein Q5P01_006661 [Channa striata]
MQQIKEAQEESCKGAEHDTDAFAKMRETDVTGLDMDVVSLQATRDKQKRNIPVIRLENDAELRAIYKFERKLGQGSFGIVYEATHTETQTKWAIKVVSKPAAGSSKVRMLGHEINILKQVNHDCIIHLKEVYDTAKMIYLVTELCSGGELNQLLRRKKYFTEDETRHIICSLAEAVVYLHKRDIVHRDLKLENILVKSSVDDNGRINIKVTDFGLSVQTDGVGIVNIMTEACGTLIYMAPEVMSGRGYSQWCDVWSVGIVMYMLLCGEPPFVSKTKETLLAEIMKEEVKFNQPIWAKVSDAAKNLLTCLLKVDPAYRMSANQILENPWITGDTNVPALPSNVLEIMRDHMEEKERSQIVEDLSLTCPKDALDPPLVPNEASTETDSNCTSTAKLSPERNGSPGSTFISTKTNCEALLQEHKNGSEIWGTATSTAQARACVKPTKQLSANSAKQRKSQDKKDFSARQKMAFDLSKTDNQRLSTSSKSENGSRKPLISSKISSHSEKLKK